LTTLHQRNLTRPKAYWQNFRGIPNFRGGDFPRNHAWNSHWERNGQIGLSLRSLTESDGWLCQGCCKDVHIDQPVRIGYCQWYTVWERSSRHCSHQQFMITEIMKCAMTNWLESFRSFILSQLAASKFCILDIVNVYLVDVDTVDTRHVDLQMTTVLMTSLGSWFAEISFLLTLLTTVVALHCESVRFSFSEDSVNLAIIRIRCRYCIDSCLLGSRSVHERCVAVTKWS